MPTPFYETRSVPAHRNPLGLDTETFLIAPGRVAPQLVCATFANTAGEMTVMDHVDGASAFAAVVKQDELLLVLANASFDMGVFCQNDPDNLPWVFRLYEDERIWDVLIWDKLWNIRHGRHGAKTFDPEIGGRPAIYSLEEGVARWLKERVEGKHGDDAWRLRYSELFGVPIEEWPIEAKEYAMKDALLAIRVQQAQAQKAGVLDDFWRQLKHDWGLQLFTARGLRTQEEVVRDAEADMRAHVDSICGDLMDKGFFNLKKEKGVLKMAQDQKVTKARCEAAYAARGMAVPRTDPADMAEKNRLKYPEGQVKIDVETLEDSEDPDLMLLAEVSNDKKLLGTYIPSVLQGCVLPINPQYDSLMATGRSSSRGPNIQNVPRKGGMRECYVPREGYIFVDCDYEIAELRALAQELINRYGYSEMADQINAGRDLHKVMAAAIMDISYDEYMRLSKEGTDQEKAQCKAMRQLGKVPDFGTPGGLGGETMAKTAKVMYGLIISTEEAKELIAKYKRTFPEMDRYLKDNGALTRGGNTTISQNGSGRVRGDCRYQQCCNTPFQAMVADGAKMACYWVAMECYLGVTHDNFDEAFMTWQREQVTYPSLTWRKWLDDCDPQWKSDMYGSYPVFFIHDEICLESPFALARKAGIRLRAVMIEAMNIFTPDVPADAKPDMKRRWYKEAEPTYDGNGELVPWTPPYIFDVVVKKCHVLSEDDKETVLALLDDLPDSTDAWLSDEAVAVLAELLPQRDYKGEDDPKYWHNVNRMWRWEVLARRRNPDPWLEAA